MGFKTISKKEAQFLLKIIGDQMDLSSKVVDPKPTRKASHVGSLRGAPISPRTTTLHSTSMNFKSKEHDNTTNTTNSTEALNPPTSLSLKLSLEHVQPDSSSPRKTPDSTNVTQSPRSQSPRRSQESKSNERKKASAKELRQQHFIEIENLKF